jgi:hypothetical protein
VVLAGPRSHSSVELCAHHPQSDRSRRYVLVLLSSGARCPRLVERMGHSHPNHPIHRRPFLRLLRHLYVSLAMIALTVATSPRITSPGCLTTVLARVRNSPPSSAVHCCRRTYSSSSGFMQRHTNARVACVPTGPSVPGKLPSIQSSPTAPSKGVYTPTAWTTNRLPPRGPSTERLPRRAVDEFRPQRDIRQTDDEEFWVPFVWVQDGHLSAAGYLVYVSLMSLRLVKYLVR